MLAKMRCQLAGFLKCLAHFLTIGVDTSQYENKNSKHNYDLIPKGHYDYIPKGCVFGSAKDFLLIPKNRYRVKLLPRQKISDELGIGWITEDNSSDSYDQLWGTASNLEAFRAEAGHIRDVLSLEIVDSVEKYIVAAENVVDIGCGIGDLLQEVRNRNNDIKVSGLDFSRKAVEGAGEAFPDGDFFHFEIERKLPYQSNTYDIVFCTDVLEHLEYPEDIIAELVRICRIDGLVVIVVPDGDVDQFLGHYWFWNKERLQKLLKKWDADIIQLPKTHEFLCCIHTAFPDAGDKT